MSDANSGPRISVVIPSLNSGQFIEEAIRSVVHQAYGNVELIVIDGGSTDASTDIIKKYQHQIHHWESRVDRGQSQALNRGFEHATGDIFGWLNADDLYLPGSLSTVASVFREKAGGAGVVFGDWKEVDTAGETVRDCLALDFSLRHLVYEAMHFSSVATFWRADIHKAVKGFDESLNYVMDYDYFLRIGLLMDAGAFVRIPEELGAFRRHPEQKTWAYGPYMRRELVRVTRKVGIRRYQWPWSLARVLYRARRAAWYLSRGGFGYLAGELHSQMREGHWLRVP